MSVFHGAMTDYLAEAEKNAGHASLDRMGSGGEAAHLSNAATFAAVATATDIRRLADAFERIATHLTLPQGTEHVAGETTGIRAPSPSPAEPEPGWECPACRYQGPQALTESSLVLLDQTEEIVAAARHLRALWQPEAAKQSAAWWRALGDLFRVVDARTSWPE